MGRFLSVISVSPLGFGRTVVALGLLVALLGGCSQGTFIGRQYDNFTAYYNTFYNASEAFEEGIESVTQATQEVDRTRYLSIFPEPQAAPNEQSFEQAIEKSADLLREHPNSKWVDDALLLIGRSYFYQENYVGAAQKFREVIALGGEHEREARFRLARTLVVTERYDEAAEVLTTALSGNEEVGPWTARMYLVRGELFVRQERWEDAELALQQGLEGDLPTEIAARAAFLLGQVRETLEKLNQAYVAYRQVLDYRPPYELRFAAQISAVELSGLHGNTERALERLRALERDDKNYEMRGQMALVRARLYRAQERFDEANEVLRESLHGEDPPSGPVRGRMHYELATLYRDVYEDFGRSAAHFDTAAVSLERRTVPGENGERASSDRLSRVPSNADAEAERFQGLAERAAAIARMDSLLHLGRLSEAELQSVLEEVRQQRRMEREEQAQEEESQRAQFQSRRRGQDPLSREREEAVQTGSSGAGFLFHKDPTRLREGQRQFQRTWGDRPRVDNWRRQAAIRESASVTASRTDEETSSSPPPASNVGRADTDEVRIDLSEIPRDSASRAQMEADRAVARYELANALFRAAERPDSASVLYRQIVEEDGDHPVARQALYALAEARRAQGDTAGARRTYRQVIEEYPNTRFAERARQQLGESSSQAGSQRLEEQADSAYAQAYETWQEGDPEDALEGFLEVARTYSAMPAAPRALLAASMVYGGNLRHDTSDASRARLVQFLDRFSPPDTAQVDSPAVSSDTMPDRRGPPREGVEPGQRTEVPPWAEQADSLRAEIEPADSLAADTTRREERREPDDLALLKTLLGLLPEHYPEAPQTNRAQAFLQALEQHRTPGDPGIAVRDVTSPSSDTTARSQGSVNENTAQEEASDTSSQQEDDPLPAPSSNATSSSQEERPPYMSVDPSAGGWTLLVGVFEDQQEASTQRRAIEEQLDHRWPVDVLSESTETTARYRLVIGHFGTEHAARRALDRVADELSEDPEVWDLSQNRDS